MPDKEAHISKVRNLTGRHGRRCGGHKREGGCALPGEVSRYAMVLPTPRGVGICREKSAVVIVV